MEKYTNDLINESSPYLQQHAHNPVNWIPWSPDVFQQAEKEDKMVLISIGYSSCHWCHVMEHESFEDEEVAALQNKLFINVKVDREEHPDVDQVYMTAVQLMTQRGGWPLNCFTLPDGRPVYGGTYFQKDQWMHIMKSLNQTFQNERSRMESYASQLHEGIIKSELITEPNEIRPFQEEKLNEMILRWSKGFDNEHGGPTKAPKFPLPSNYEFLLEYALHSDDEHIMNHVENTLDKMAMGGIYDQIGGGFARYSVDMLWKVPHFEKMLYDNGQLITLYSTAYKVFQKPLYKQVVYQTIDWLIREMRDDSGAFYSALDADSEGKEGKFYIWTEEELKEVLSKEYQWVKAFYSINNRAYWEDGYYILLRTESDKEFAKKMSWTIDELYDNINRVNQLLLDARDGRIRPGLDNKLLTSWNAMTLKGLLTAHQVFSDDLFLDLAVSNATWIKSRVMEDFQVIRSGEVGDRQIPGVLEDYAHVIDAFITAFETTGNSSYIEYADSLMQYCLKNFQDEKSGMFYYTPSNSKLIARKMELSDNVIPSSNSVMARNLYYLSLLLNNPSYMSISKQMLANVYEGMEHYGAGYSNWAILLNHFVYGFYEIVCTGESAREFAEKFQQAPITKALICYNDSNDESLPVFSGRSSKQGRIYVCTHGTCHAPVESVSEAMDLVIH